MGLLNTQSLSLTLNAVNESHLLGRPIAPAERKRLADWIASRQGLPGAYRQEWFAPTEQDFAEGIRLFTGERIATGLGTAHILGQEACRALLLLLGAGGPAGEALDRASAGVAIFLTASAAYDRSAGRTFLGRYCCGKCSVSLWRHLAAGGMAQGMRRQWLAAGMAGLKAARSGDGRCRSMPFWYVLSALEAIDSPAALAEVRYAAPTLQRLLKRPAGEDTFARRRRVVAERCLARC